jgi:hypothetical protein
MFDEIIADYSENHMKFTNTLSGQMQGHELLKQVVYIVNSGIERVKFAARNGQIYSTNKDDSLVIRLAC